MKIKNIEGKKYIGKEVFKLGLLMKFPTNPPQSAHATLVIKSIYLFLMGMESLISQNNFKCGINKGNNNPIAT